MMSTMSKDALARAIEHGEYVVDTRAVAEAMLRRANDIAGSRAARARRPSPVLVPAQSVYRPAARVQQDDPAPEADVA